MRCDDDYIISEYDAGVVDAFSTVSYQGYSSSSDRDNSDLNISPGAMAGYIILVFFAALTLGAFSTYALMINRITGGQKKLSSNLL